MRVFSAKITAGQIIADGGLVVNCPILGQGGDSEGVIVISNTELAYIPNTTPDLNATIAQAVGALNGAIEALNAISQGVLPENGGGMITQPNFASGISSGVEKIQNSVSALNELRGKLK